MSAKRGRAPEENEENEENEYVANEGIAKKIASLAPWEYNERTGNSTLGKWFKFRLTYTRWDRDNSIFARLESYMPSLCAPIAEESESEVTAGTGAAVASLAHSGACRVLGQGTFGAVVLVAPRVAMKVINIRMSQSMEDVKREATNLWVITQYAKQTGDKIGPTFYSACLFSPSVRFPFGRLVIFFEALQGVTITRFLSETPFYKDSIPENVALIQDLPGDELKAAFILEIEKGLQRYMTICKRLGLWHLDLKSANMILFIEKRGVDINFRYLYAIDYGSSGLEGDRYNTHKYPHSPYTSLEHHVKKGNANAVELAGTLTRTSSSALRIGPAFDKYSANKIRLDIWYALKSPDFYEAFKRRAKEQHVNIKAFETVVERATKGPAAKKRGGTRKYKRKIKRTRKHNRSTRYN